MTGPLEQFAITSIIPITVKGVDIPFTNASFWMMLSVVVSVIFFVLATSKRALIPGPVQAFAENLYDVVVNMISDNVGVEGKAYFPFIFSVFIFVLAGNLLGMLPGSFTFTSHLAVTLFMSFFIFTAITLIGIFRHGFRFFSLFFPSGAPLWTAIVLIPIELISYFSRPISLGVRLFANMVVGHVLLKVIAGFVVILGTFYILPGVLPFFGVVAITVLEIMIAVIQAYVFAILACVYLHDSLHLH